MEFDDIKKAWKNSFKEDELLNKNEIEAKLKIKSKSNTALKKVKFNYKIELFTSVVLTIFAMIWLSKNITANNKILILIVSFLFFGALVLFAAYNYLKVKNTVISTDQLKPALKETIWDIERYVKFSRSNFTKFILFPFTILFGMFLGLTMGAEHQKLLDVLVRLENQAIFKMIVVFIIACAGMIPFSIYLNNRMYKRHLDELKSCLKEFEQIEEENGN